MIGNKIMESKPPISVKTISPHKMACRITGIPIGSHTPIPFFIIFLPDMFHHSHWRIYMQKIQMHILYLSNSFLQFEKKCQNRHQIIFTDFRYYSKIVVNFQISESVHQIYPAPLQMFPSDNQVPY